MEAPVLKPKSSSPPTVDVSFRGGEKVDDAEWRLNLRMARIPTHQSYTRLSRGHPPSSGSARRHGRKHPKLQRSNSHDLQPMLPSGTAFAMSLP